MFVHYHERHYADLKCRACGAEVQWRNLSFLDDGSSEVGEARLEWDGLESSGVELTAELDLANLP